MKRQPMQLRTTNADEISKGAKIYRGGGGGGGWGGGGKQLATEQSDL